MSGLGRRVRASSTRAWRSSGVGPRRDPVLGFGAQHVGGDQGHWARVSEQIVQIRQFGLAQRSAQQQSLGEGLPRLGRCLQCFLPQSRQFAELGRKSYPHWVTRWASSMTSAARRPAPAASRRLFRSARSNDSGEVTSERYLPTGQVCRASIRGSPGRFRLSRRTPGAGLRGRIAGRAGPGSGARNRRPARLWEPR